MKLHRAALICFCFLTAAATACGSSAKPTATSAATSTTIATPNAATVTATDKDNGTTVAAKVGSRVDVVLASTYWTFAPVSDASVLRPVGTPVVNAQLKGCVPGQGCGTVTASFAAVAPGTAVVSASRTSCGEAMRCSAAAGSYRVTVAVTA